MLDWLTEYWALALAPAVVFLAFVIVSFWLRGFVFRRIKKSGIGKKWEGSEIIITAIRRHFIYWVILLGAFIAVLMSLLTLDIKSIAFRIIGSLLVISLTWMLLTISEKLLVLFLDNIHTLKTPTRLIINIARAVIILIGILVIIELWGAPATPVMLVLTVAVIVLIVATRDTLLNMFSALEIATSSTVKTGDFIKLGTGEEGYVTEISWRNTRVKTLDNLMITIPNSKLVQSTLINYGRPLKIAEEPFHFFTRLHLKELTGLKASNLHELVDKLKIVPDSVIYYHTHQFLEEHQYLTPEPANSFALWVEDALNDNVLAEKLAAIDTFTFSAIEPLRQRLISVIQEHIARGNGHQSAPEGNEFYFIKSISTVIQTPYVAHDLREFVEVLRKVTINSLYFHIFESRLRLHKSSNDFSIWIKDTLSENDLAEKIASLDPYTFTLEGLRSTIIQLIEKRIK